MEISLILYAVKLKSFERQLNDDDDDDDDDKSQY
jgi:hypothetical protein